MSKSAVKTNRKAAAEKAAVTRKRRRSCRKAAKNVRDERQGRKAAATRSSQRVGRRSARGRRRCSSRPVAEVFNAFQHRSRRHAPFLVHQGQWKA